MARPRGRLEKREVEAARRNPAIIRNKLKIEAAVNNARAFLAVQDKHGAFERLIWSFTDGEVIHNDWKASSEIPASTPLSDKVSKALKKEGFSFVGTTICYSLLQAGGIVNDHIVSCFRHRELNGGG